MSKILSSDWITGVDIGGSHITVGLINMKTRKVVDDIIIRQWVDCHAPADEILTGWCDAIKKLQGKIGLESTPLGFAMPGPFDYENGICLIRDFDKYESLYKMNIREELAGRLNLSGGSICFRNDAEAFLDGELFCGAAQGYTHAIGVTLGTGLGSAYSHNGKTADAELSVLEYKGGKIEECVSTRGVTRAYERLTGKVLKDAKAVVDLYDSDRNAREVFTNFSNDLSWFLSYFIERESPEVLVIGGNIANAWDLFMGDIINQLSLSVNNLPKIVKAALGENAALIGGACGFNKVLDQQEIYHSAIDKTPII